MNISDTISVRSRLRWGRGGGLRRTPIAKDRNNESLGAFGLYIFRTSNSDQIRIKHTIKNANTIDYAIKLDEKRKTYLKTTTRPSKYMLNIM